MTLVVTPDYVADIRRRTDRLVAELRSTLMAGEALTVLQGAWVVIFADTYKDAVRGEHLAEEMAWTMLRGVIELMEMLRRDG